MGINSDNVPICFTDCTLFCRRCIVVLAYWSPMSMGLGNIWKVLIGRKGICLIIFFSCGSRSLGKIVSCRFRSSRWRHWGHTWSRFGMWCRLRLVLESIEGYLHHSIKFLSISSLHLSLRNGGRFRIILLSFESSFLHRTLTNPFNLQIKSNIGM